MSFKSPITFLETKILEYLKHERLRIIFTIEQIKQLYKTVSITLLKKDVQKQSTKILE